MDESDNRFVFLLEPIRDLSKNWNIDIAAELEEYLDEIEDINITFDDGNTNLNFAEAALLIQGSACIYSRKVEYLYSLVFQTLDYIQEKKKRQKTKTHIMYDDPDVETGASWLTLDDELVVSDNIDLKESVVPDIRFALQTPAGRQRGHLVPRTPAALLDINEDTDVKIGSCAVHPSGALVLDRTGASLDDLFYDNVEADMPSMDFGAGEDIDFDDDVPLPGLDLDEGAVGPSLALERVAQAQAAAILVPDIEVNPWKEADPHDRTAGGIKGFIEKPFKKGNTVRAIGRRVPAVTSTGDFLRAAAFPDEFSALYVAEARRRAILQRRVKKTQPQIVPQVELDTGLDVGGFDVDDDDFDGTWDEPMAIEESIEQIPEVNTAEMTYEQMCRHQIDEYMRECAAFVKQTALQTRVKTWHERIAPLLEIEQNRVPFDVDVSGNDILQRFKTEAKDEPDPTDYVSFKDLVSDAAPQFSVCRSFFACLQLANDGNVIIGENNDGGFMPKLALVGQREDRVEKFKAPSAKTQSRKGRKRSRKIKK